MWFAYLPAYTPAKSHTLHQHVEIAVYNSATENVLRPCNSAADDTEKEDVIHVHLSTPAPVCAVPFIKNGHVWKAWHSSTVYIWECILWSCCWSSAPAALKRFYICIAFGEDGTLQESFFKRKRFLDSSHVLSLLYSTLFNFSVSALVRIHSVSATLLSHFK